VFAADNAAMIGRFLVGALLLACGLAHAGLDGKPGDAPAATVRTSSSATSAGVPYTEVSRTLATGTVVREYADASGTVFAVSWSGPYKPDLKQLLGSHFAAFRDAAAAGPQRRANRARVPVDTGDLVAHSGGHMGAFEGRAWLRSRLPAGFDPQEDVK
jgi:hypothetical protein